MDLLKFRNECGEGDDESLVKAVATIDPTVLTPDQAKIWIWTLVRRLLDTDRYALAGLVLWGESLFDCRPKSVSRILKFVQANQNMIFLGAASMGKTYTLVAYSLLDWIRDPEHTEIKFLSTTGGHAKSQAFSTLQRLYKAAIVPLPGLSMDMAICLDPKDKHSAISLIAIPQGDSGRAVLQGFHPTPRPRAHPIFGTSSRVRCLIDEAEEAPDGIFFGIANLLSAAWGPNQVKVYCCTNPRDDTSRLAQLAEPPNGWTTLSMDEKTWISSEHWHVMRIDGADCENVVEKRLVFGGLLTWEGYNRLATELGGQSPRYLTFARGCYPLTELQSTLIPYSLLEGVIGQFIFDGRTIGCAGIDLAFEGGDRVIMFVGRYGRAIGFTPINGKAIVWQKGRYVTQADQYYELPKEKTIALATSIETRLKQLHVHPDWVTCDRTGVGTGVHDALCEQWSASIRGVMWGSESGERRLMADDHDFAVEIYDGITTEMYARARKWAEFGLVALHPNIQTGQLFKELTGRRYQPSTKGPSGKPRIRLEPKKEYRQRLQISPDIADAFVMLLHGCALNGPEKASMIGSERKPRFAPGQTLGPRESIHYVDFSQDL